MKINFMLSILAVLLFVNFANACSCIMPEDPKSELDKSFMVFEGKVLAISENGLSKQVTFKVSQVWKGESEQKLIVETASDSAGCGFDFSVDKEYLVYALGNSTDLFVNSCGRTNLLSLAEEDLAEFAAGNCACTMDVKECSDGSFVGRVCPDCKFAQCPNSNKTFNLSNGRNAEIKIMPETASQKAIDRLGELNFSIELKEVGKGNETRVVYEVSAEKEGKIFGLFRAKGKVTALVNAENGEIEKVNKPWWAIFASGI